MPETDDNTISARLTAGQQVLKAQVRKDRDYSARFKDPSAYAAWVYPGDNNAGEDDYSEIPQPAAVGNTPYVQTNIRTKLASIGHTNPDWYVETQDPTLADIPKEVMKTLWRERGWMRIANKAALKRMITGMGAVCCYWRDPDPSQQFGGPILEHVQLKDIAVDPHVVDWHDLRWGARRIRMPRDEAQKRWPNVPALGQFSKEHASDDSRKGSAVEIWIYWDRDTEATVFNGKTVLSKGPNLYGCVPLVFYEGDIDPITEFGMGDMDATVGLQVMATYLDDIVNAAARHSRSIFLYNVDAFGGKQEKEIEHGLQQGMIGVIGTELDEAVRFTATEPIGEALPMAQQHVLNGMDAAQGVNQYMRGVVNNPSKFATEVAATEGSSGARGDQDRKEYEGFLNRIARMVIRWLIEFSKPESEEDMLLLESLETITEICVVEQSTTYKNPESQYQKAVNLFQTLAGVAPILGMNLRPLAEDILIAAGKRNLNRYFGQPSPQMAPTEQPGMAPGPVPSPPATGQGAAVSPAPAPTPQALPMGGGLIRNGK